MTPPPPEVPPPPDVPPPPEVPQDASSKPRDESALPGAGPADTSSPQPAETIESLRAKRDELESKLIRAFADYQNAVRRSQQIAAAAREQQLFEVAKPLVNVLDHFDNALNIDPAKASVESVLKGLHIVRDELLKTLEQFGVRRLDVAPGQEFDPNSHEAMMRRKTEGMDAHHVAEQLQAGYLLGDKTLRPAKVIVAE